MSRFFNLDSPVMQFLFRVCDLMILNVLFIISCIPIFTAGAAMTALYTMVFRIIRKEEGYIFKGYWQAFAANFRQATPLWLLCLVLFFFLQYDRLIVDSLGGGVFSVIRVLFYTVVLILAAMFLFVWPVLARFVCTTRQAVKNALFLCIGHFPYTILILLYYVCVWLVMTRSILLLSIVLTVSIFIGFSFSAWVTGHLYLRIFRRYEEGLQQPGDE